MLRDATFESVETISQRQLRNDSAEVLRGAEAGDTYIITRRGVPVAQLGPITDDAGLRCVRPARTRPDFSSMERATLSVPSEEILEDLRGDR